MLKRLLTFATHRIHNLPVIVLMPHSRCNCRCVMCDIWKANNNKQELSVDLLLRHARDFKKLGVREVVFSGGEALMHSNLWRFCEVLRDQGVQITLLSTGLLLSTHSKQIVANFRDVIVSLDGSREIHDRIRNVPNAFQKLADGVRSLKAVEPDFPVSGRCVIQRGNYSDFNQIVRSAREIGLDRISFLAADVSSFAFNRPDLWDDQRAGSVALTPDEVGEFERIVTNSFEVFRHEYASRFIAESPEKMSRIVQYYKAIHGTADFPMPVCNAPWVSAVIESDGSVMPCFFHKPYGNIHNQTLPEILNSREAVMFRKQLDMAKDPTCKKCVCSLKLGVTQLN